MPKFEIPVMSWFSINATSFAALGIIFNPARKGLKWH